jgi:hypothetical protein
MRQTGSLIPVAKGVVVPPPVFAKGSGGEPIGSGAPAAGAGTRAKPIGAQAAGSGTGAKPIGAPAAGSRTGAKAIGAPAAGSGTGAKPIGQGPARYWQSQDTSGSAWPWNDPTAGSGNAMRTQGGGRGSGASGSAGSLGGIQASEKENLRKRAADFSKAAEQKRCRLEKGEVDSENFFDVSRAVYDASVAWC